MISILYPKPFDTTTEGGRSRERYRRALWTSAASLLAKGVAAFTLLVSVPLTLSYLGPERYGLWMTIGSIITLLGLVDLAAVGNELMNAVSEAKGRDDRDMARRYVSSAFFSLVGVALLLGVLFGMIYPFVPWDRIFNVSSAIAVAEAGPAVAVFVGCLLVSVPLGVVQRIQLGHQEGFVHSLWQALGNVFRLGGVLIAIRFEAGLPWLVLAMSGGPVLGALLNGLVLFGFRYRWLRPRWRWATIDASRRVLNIGVLFLVLYFATAVAFSSDNIVAAQILGPEAVAEYSVTMRLFGLVPVLLGVMVAPLWPAYREALARGDLRWLGKTLKRSLVLTLVVTSPVAVGLVIFGADLVHLWVGALITPSLELLLGFGLWGVVSSLVQVGAVFLNGIGAVRFHVVLASLAAMGGIAGKIMLAQAFGLTGIIWAAAVSYALFMGIPMTVFLARFLSRTRPIAEASTSTEGHASLVRG